MPHPSGLGTIRHRFEACSGQLGANLGQLGANLKPIRANKKCLSTFFNFSPCRDTFLGQLEANLAANLAQLGANSDQLGANLRQLGANLNEVALLFLVHEAARHTVSPTSAGA